MDHTERDSRIEPGLRNEPGAGLGRRAFFSRALLAAGATAGLLTLTGCPGGDQDDDDDDDDD